MDIDNFKPNSHRAKEEKKTSPANTPDKKESSENVKGEVIIRKKSFMKEMLNAFFVNDISDLKHYMIFDVVIPKAKDIVSNIIEEVTNMMLYGDAGKAKGYSSSGRGTYVSYNNYSSSGKQKNVTSSQSTPVFDEFEYTSRGAAMTMLDDLQDILAQYGKVRVADIYDLYSQNFPNGPTIVAPYTANDYGWENLDSVQPRHLLNGNWVLTFPKARPLNR